MTDAPREREGEGGWAKLRRRKVVQWGLAYAAGAWALLEGIGFFADTFHWPEISKQLAALALIAGLPIAVTLAWYHGDRGQQRPKRSEFAILALLLLATGSMLWFFGHRTVPTKGTTAATGADVPAAQVSADSRPSIAVLPFENRSRLDDDVFFVDGIHDDILTQLSKVSALKVISRTSVERFRDTQQSTKEIAEQLGVGSILEGGVQRAGDRVRIHVQLIDAETDAHLWAESYDRELTASNIFAIQSDVAQAIAGALQAALTASEKTRAEAVPTRSLDSWEAYQLGRQRLEKRSSAALDDAERFFRRAIGIDPEFALAHAGLADALALQVEYSDRPRQATLAEAARAASTALELDPNLAEGWGAKGIIAIQGQEWVAAEQMLHRATTLDPNYAPAQHWRSVTLANAGRFEEAVESAERALEVDPLSAVLNTWLGVTLEFAGRYDEAAGRHRRAVEINPDMSWAYHNLANLYAYTWNRFAAAVPIMERAVSLDDGDPSLFCKLILLHLNFGDDSQAMKLTSEALARWPESPVVKAVAAYVFASLQDGAAAERYAREALAREARDTLAVEVLRNADLGRADYAAALARYEQAYPELLGSPPRVDVFNFDTAVSVALVQQKMGHPESARGLLEQAQQATGVPGSAPPTYAFAGMMFHALRGDRRATVAALRGDRQAALAALREAERAGWRFGWRYYRDVDPNVASIRGEPEFVAVFADIERDMARQRAELAARPKDAKLEPGGNE